MHMFILLVIFINICMSLILIIYNCRFFVLMNGNIRKGQPCFLNKRKKEKQVTLCMIRGVQVIYNM